MAQTLLLLKLLVGRDLRNRAVLSPQNTYATLSINQEIEVRSSLIRHGGRTPEWNQLFILEVGPWWRGKELVLQVFAQNKLLSDSFIGGCNCQLGELVRAVGLEEDPNAPNSANGAIISPYPHRPSISSPRPLAIEGQRNNDAAADAANLAPVNCFQRPTVKEIRSFGELLPILPTTQQLHENGTQNESHSSSSTTTTPTTSRSHHAADAALLSLPLTWLMLRHGGGSAKLKQYPLPAWNLPAGRVAVYLDYIVLPAARVPNGLPSSILPAAWLTMADNEKLAFAAQYRSDRLRPIQNPGGVMGLVASFNSVASGQPIANSYASPSRLNGQQPRYPIYGRNGANVGVGGLPAPGVAQPWPWSLIASILETAQRSNIQDRIFYSYFFILAFTCIVTELFFYHPSRFTESNSSVSFLSSLLSFFTFTRLFPLFLGCLSLKLGWNMVNDEQLSHPWRRLDLILTLILGLALGPTSMIGLEGTWKTRVLAMLALAVTHGYTRAALYGHEVVTGVVEQQLRLASLAVSAARPFPPGHGPQPIVDPSSIPLWRGLLAWTHVSLVAAWKIGVKWVTGNLSTPNQAGAEKQVIHGSIHLALRSAFFLLGQIVSYWAFHDLSTFTIPIHTRFDHWLVTHSSLTMLQFIYFLIPCFGYLFLFLFASGKDSPIKGLKGRPWLILFVLNSIAFGYGCVSFIPRVCLWILSRTIQTVWNHKWPLIGLPIEYLATVLFIPHQTFQAAAINLVKQPQAVSNDQLQMNLNFNYIPHQNHEPVGGVHPSAPPYPAGIRLPVHPSTDVAGSRVPHRDVIPSPNGVSRHRLL